MPKLCRHLSFLLTIYLTVSCSGGTSGQAAAPSAKYLIVAGDIAQCILAASDPALPARKTAELVKTLLAKYGDQAQVLTLGDNVYNTGTTTEFENCYKPTWGQFIANTWATPGNHDYGVPKATGYYDYFGSAAGIDQKGYYTKRLGSWTIYSLNSNVPADDASEQSLWLSSQLSKDQGCKLAAWHYPLFTSAPRGDNPTMRAIWAKLDAAKFDAILQGHEHQYERFAPRKADGSLAEGVRSFVVGTGGASLTGFQTPQLGSLVRSSTFGVLVLKLEADRYEWSFIDTASNILDSGTARCRAFP
jgi:acid phosphatase type 7